LLGTALASNNISETIDVHDVSRIMAGFERTVPGPVSRTLRSGKYLSVADQVVVPAGERHAVREGETQALCGRAVVSTNGEWVEKRGLGFRDCSACRDEATRAQAASTSSPVPGTI
jgi:hypothetical protein